MYRKIILIIAAVLLLLGAMLFLYQFSTIVGLLFFAAMLAYLFYPGVRAFSEQGIPSIVAILIVYAMAASVLLFVCLVILPNVYEESRGFLASLPLYYLRFENYLATLQQWMGNLLDGVWLEQINTSLMSFFTEFVEQLGQQGLNLVLSLPQWIIFIVLGPVLSYYFLRDREKIAARCLAVFPPTKRSTVLILSKNIDIVLRNFVRGNLLVALIVASLTALGLFLFGVNYSMTLGILAGLFNIIPYFGPILGSIPILLVAILQPDVNALWVLLFILALQQVDSVFITPKVIGDNMGMHPVTVIILVLIGGLSGGLAGMILVIPLAAVGKVLLQFFYENFVAFRPAD